MSNTAPEKLILSSLTENISTIKQRFGTKFDKTSDVGTCTS